MTLSPWHSGVLTTAALVSSPATWAALVSGTLPVADALTRFLLCVLLCWVVLNVALPLLVPRQPWPSQPVGVEEEQYLLGNGATPQAVARMEDRSGG